MNHHPKDRLWKPRLVIGDPLRCPHTRSGAGKAYPTVGGHRYR